jgi:hypothetical protein
MEKYPKIEVIPADPGPPPEIKWVVHELRGTPVYESLAHLHEGRPMVEAPPVGTEVLVYGGWGWARATFTGAQAENDTWVYPMEFDDEQKFWICVAVINKKCIPQLLQMRLKGETADAELPPDDG